MDPVTIALIASGVLKLGSKIFGGRSERKKQEERNRSAAAGLTIQQKQKEDARRARLAYGAGLLGSIPGRPETALDPALVAKLDKERTYDFRGAMPRSVGGTDAFLSGLFGGAADVVPYMFGGNAAAAGGTEVPGSGQAGVKAIDLDELRALGKTRSSYA